MVYITLGCDLAISDVRLEKIMLKCHLIMRKEFALIPKGGTPKCGLPEMQTPHYTGHFLQILDDHNRIIINPETVHCCMPISNVCNTLTTSVMQTVN